MYVEFMEGTKYPKQNGKLSHNHKDFTDCGHVIEPNEVIIDIDVSPISNTGMTKDTILKLIQGWETQRVETERGFHLYFTYDDLGSDEKFAPSGTVLVNGAELDVEYKTVGNRQITIKQNGKLRPITYEGKRQPLPDCFLTNDSIKKVLPPAEIVPFDGKFDYDRFYNCVKQLKDKGYFDVGGNYNNWNTFVAALVTMVKEQRITDNQGKSLCTLIDCGDNSTYEKYKRHKAGDTNINFGFIVNGMKQNNIDMTGVCIDNRWLGHWERKLEVNQFGKNVPSRTNVGLILNNDPLLISKIGYNEFTYQIEVTGEVPWKRVAMTPKWEDTDEACLRVYMDAKYGISQKDAIADVLSTMSSNHSFHPVKDYFNGLNWDGKERVKTLFVDYLGIEDTELNRKQTELFFCAVVARIFEAGCKWDYVILLKGEQGLGKSSFVHHITPNSLWYTDSIDNVEGKDTLQSLQGKLIVEFGELSAMSKKEAESIKAFLTRQVDIYRPSYGRYDVTRPRQCVFVGTTNDDTPLRDETGGRRWWIMDATKKWFEQEEVLGKIDVDQVWSEAVQLYRQLRATNGILALPRQLEEQANAIQRDNTALGIFESELVHALDEGEFHLPLYEGSELYRTCAKQLWEHVLGRDLKELKEVDIKRINAILKAHPKYVKGSRSNFSRYGKVQVFERIV